jgi:hypothetical protein
MELIKTGSWVWRENEVSYSKFSKFNREDKQKHINFLLNIGIENLSTNDWYILNHYAPEKVTSTEKVKKFLEL